MKILEKLSVQELDTQEMRITDGGMIDPLFGLKAFTLWAFFMKGEVDDFIEGYNESRNS